MIRFYIKDKEGYLQDITNDPVVKQYLQSKVDIAEHFAAQIEYKKDHPDHIRQPIVIGISKSKFRSLITHISSSYKNFSNDFFEGNNCVSLLMGNFTLETIRIVNLDNLLINDKTRNIC